MQAGWSSSMQPPGPQNWRVEYHRGESVLEPMLFPARVDSHLLQLGIVGQR